MVVQSCEFWIGSPNDMFLFWVGYWVQKAVSHGLGGHVFFEEVRRIEPNLQAIICVSTELSKVHLTRRAFG